MHQKEKCSLRSNILIQLLSNSMIRLVEFSQIALLKSNVYKIILRINFVRKGKNKKFVAQVY